MNGSNFIQMEQNSERLERRTKLLPAMRLETVSHGDRLKDTYFLRLYVQ